MRKVDNVIASRSAEGSTMNERISRTLVMMWLGLALGAVATDARAASPGQMESPDTVHVALILGTNTTGPAPSGLPASALKALTDASGVLAFKRFEVLDQAVLPGEGAPPATELKGPNHRAYRLQLSLSKPGPSLANDRLVSVRLTDSSSTRPGQPSMELVQTELSARVGETVVVGVSKPVTAAGDQAILLLITPLGSVGAAARSAASVAPPGTTRAITAPSSAWSMHVALLEASNSAGPSPSGLDARLASVLENASRVGPYKRFELLDQGVVRSEGDGRLALSGPGARRLELVAAFDGAVASGRAASVSLRLFDADVANTAGGSPELIRAEFGAKANESVMVWSANTSPAADRSTLVLIVTPNAGAAVQPGAGASKPQFRASADVARLDVSVLDRDGHPVRGLTVDDFVVLEDGRPRPVVAFSAVDIPDASAPERGWQHDIASDVSVNQPETQRIIVIVMDDAMDHAMPEGPRTAETGRKIARAVVDRLGPNDLAAVVFTSIGRSQDLTKDRSQLLAAIDTYQPHAPTQPEGITAATRWSGETSFRDPLEVNRSVPRAGTFLTLALDAVAAALEGAPVGRKSIVLISATTSYDFTLRDLTTAADEAELWRTFWSLQFANTNVYTFDPTGVSQAGIRNAQDSPLAQLATNTGGRATFGTNAPWEQVPQVFRESGSYYLLGIQPAGDAEDGHARTLTVSVRRPNSEVRVRSGYYSPQAVARRPRRKTTTLLPGLDRAFGAPLPSGTLPVSVTAAPFALPGGKQAAVAVTIGVQRPANGTGTIGTLEVLTAAFDDGFKERATHRQIVDLALAPGDGGDGQVELQARLDLRPGRYQVRAAAESRPDAGGVFTQVEVPDFSKAALSVSGLVLGRMRRSDVHDAVAGLVPVLPTTTRTFVQTEHVTAFLRVYQGGRAATRSVRVRARILDAAGRAVFEETSPIDAASFGQGWAADYRLELPLPGLDAGEYLLTIEAADGQATALRNVRFAVGTSR
jgi:VWFA-related protein